ncbi:anti-sigma factor domain-containing protein [Ammoniphilus resinae]|uniref:anti-sigma factor domain-containing protein n=1 Tax=Ammoniphilus resinae TaxID=861532 RepID=UPI001AE6E297|nr:anti-sigma factor domain-containing protein [Ammoniphilus resinae]
MKKGVIIESQKKWTVVLTPDGEFCKIPFEASHIVGEEVFFRPTTVSSFNTKRKWKPFTLRTGSMVAACLLLLLISFPFFGGSQAYAAVTIDINPSIELEVDEQSLVIDAHSLNPDGKILLQSIQWKDKALSIVTVAIIDSAEDNGMMNEEKQVIITTTFYKDEPENLDEKWKTMLGDIDEQVDQDLTVVIVEGKEDWAKEAKEKQVPTGSYMMVKQAEKQGVTIQEKEIKEGKVKFETPVPGIKVIHSNQGKAPEHSNGKKKEEITEKKADKVQDKLLKEKMKVGQKEEREKLKEQIEEKLKELRKEEREELKEKIKEKLEELRKEEKEKFQGNLRWNDRDEKGKASQDKSKDSPSNDKSWDDRKDSEKDKVNKPNDDQHGKSHADHRVENQKDQSNPNKGNGKNNREQNNDKKEKDKKDPKEGNRD